MNAGLILSTAVIIFSSAVSFPGSAVMAADAAATINIDYSTLTPIGLGIRGVNNENTGAPTVYRDDDYIGQVTSHDRLGYVRFPGGTNINVFNWKTGAVDDEFLAQYFKGQRHYYRYLGEKRRAETKGFERIGDYRDFLQRTGVKGMINVNVFQHTPGEVGDLAKYLYDNHVPVVYFELGNEVAFYTAESGNSNPQYITGTDYANRMRAYDTAIKANYPGAKTVISLSNHQHAVYDNDLFSYPDKFWDGVTTHRFQGDGDTMAAAMRSGNQALDRWDEYLDHYPAGRPIYVGEYGPTLNGTLARTQYHGIYVAESALRLTRRSQISTIGGFRLTNGIFTPARRHAAEMEDAYQRGRRRDTTTFDYRPFYSAPAVALRVVDGGLNKSSATWTTTVTGGATVLKPDGSTMPALLATAYRGDNGKTYLIVTNKSGKSHEVTVKVNGGNVTKELTRTYVAHPDPGARNTASAPDTVSIRSGATGNPVLIPGYSVTRIQWQRSATPLPPRTPSLSHADPASGTVTLKWHHQFAARGYKVRYGTSPGTYLKTIDVGFRNSYPVTGLDDGRTYYFAIRAYNGTGESPHSNEITATLARPAAPTITDTYSERSRRVGVEWRSVPGATGYKVKVGTAPGVYARTIDAGNNVGQIIKGLANDQRHYFAVVAYNGFGESRLSAERSETPVPGLPLAPRGLTIVDQSPTDVTLTWLRTRVETHRDYFEDGAADRWDPALGAWQVVSHPDPARETYVYRSPSSGRAVSAYQPVTTDHEADATVQVNSYGANSQVGLVTRYTDNGNYYRFVYNAAQDDFRIVRVAGGTEDVLASVPRARLGVNPTSMTMRFHVAGRLLQGKVNSLGVVLSVKDSTLTNGRFGVYSNNQEVLFDGVRIRRDVADRFNVYRSTRPASGFAMVATVSARTFRDTGLVADESYFYQVTAVNERGESYGHSNTYKKN